MMLAGINVVLVDDMTLCQDAQSCLAIEVDSLKDWHQCQCAVFLVRGISPATPTFVHTTTKARQREWRRQGAVSLVVNLFSDETVFIGDFFSDDDASARVVLHSVEDLIEAGKMKKEEWPRYNGKGAAKKPDNGKLPINHPLINFLADKGHRVQGYGKKYFALAALCKEKNLGCTKLDAKRMKRRTSWSLRIATKSMFDEFKSVVLEHHFDNHEHCGGRCIAKGKTGEEKKKSSLRLCSKTKNAAMYEMLLAS
jgi:hypothetical protein